MSRVEVLEKVKDLLLLPKTELITTRKVAEFYEVEVEAIHSLLYDHKTEIFSDGYKVYEAKELISLMSNTTSSQEVVSKTRGGRGGYFLNNEMIFSYSKSGVYTKRAVLRVGMLLRDSHIAKKVRDQLLNITEKTSDDIKVQSIDEESILILAAVKAKTQEEKIEALNKLNKYNARYREEARSAFNEIIEEKNNIIKEQDKTIDNIKKLLFK